MKKLLLVMVLAIAGCEKLEKPKIQDPGRMCDYCKQARVDSKAYPCRQCGKVHWSCNLESPLHAIEYSKASKTAESGGALGMTIKRCPE